MAPGHFRVYLATWRRPSVAVVARAPARADRAPDAGRERVHVMAYLEITLNVSSENRAGAAAVFHRFKQPFLDTAAGAISKELLVRDADVQVLHGFDTAEQAAAYLDSALFAADIVAELSPLLAAAPEIRIYQVA